MGQDGDRKYLVDAFVRARHLSSQFIFRAHNSLATPESMHFYSSNSMPKIKVHFKDEGAIKHSSSSPSNHVRCQANGRPHVVRDFLFVAFSPGYFETSQAPLFSGSLLGALVDLFRLS